MIVLPLLGVCFLITRAMRLPRVTLFACMRLCTCGVVRVGVCVCVCVCEFWVLECMCVGVGVLEFTKGTPSGARQALLNLFRLNSVATEIE